MKRRTVAAIWIAGSTVPVLLATVFIFGCCVLDLSPLIPSSPARPRRGHPCALLLFPNL